MLNPLIPIYYEPLSELVNYTENNDIIPIFNTFTKNNCPMCNKIFNSKSHLKQHLNKKYKCIQNNQATNLPLIEDANNLDTYYDILNDLKKKQENHTCFLNQIETLTKENKYLKSQLINVLDIVKNTFLTVKT